MMKVGYRIPVMVDTDGTPLWMGERMVEVAPGEWVTQAAADFSGSIAAAAASLDTAVLGG